MTVKPAAIVGSLLILFSTPIVNAAPFVTLDARSMAMGGIGVASGIRYAAFNNPALLAYELEYVDWSLIIPSAGRSISDPDKFDTALNNFQNLSHTQPAANATLNALDNLVNKEKVEKSFFAIEASIPNKVSGAIFLNSYTVTSLKSVVGNPDLSDPASPVYNSILEKQGISIIEHGVSFAHVNNPEYRGFKSFSIGFSPKIVLAQAVRSNEDISSAVTTVSFRNSQTVSAFNVDVGALQELGRYRAGLVVKNVIPMEFKNGPGYGSVKFSPQARAGFAYQQRTHSWEIDLDLTPNGSVGFEGKTRYLAMGMEYLPADWFQFRAGYRQNLLAKKDAIVSLGLGFGSNLHLDLAAFGGRQELGAAAQLGYDF